LGRVSLGWRKAQWATAMEADALDELRAQATQALQRVQGFGDVLDHERDLLIELRNARLYEPMGQLAEAICRRLPADSRSRRLYAQCLIELGWITAAICVLKAQAARLPRDDPEHAEALGLLGRAYKQLFFDATDKASDAARDALKQAIAVYRKPFEENPDNTWHGVNLVALLARARRLGLRLAPDLQPATVAQEVIDRLNRVPPDQRDEWFHPTLAQAALGLDDWDQVEAALNTFVADDHAQAFQIAGTLRQFTQVWDVGAIDARGLGLIDILRARLLQVSGGELTLRPAALRRARERAEPEPGQLEAVLGEFGAKTFRWWKTGLERASAVCAIRSKVGDRVGTGWLVRAGSLQCTPEDELMVLTNFHVVNELGASPGLPPDAAELVFEALDASRVYTVKAIAWSSPPERHDASLLRLNEPVTGIAPLPLARALPIVEDTAHVYVIGHPGGRDLAFSLQDNALIDHEGPPNGAPPIEGVCRVHYRAPTEGGSSGSPVFNAALWEVIALHHKGGKIGMPQLNGKTGTYGANEGIWIQSIVAAKK